ncbi:hypothetical protein QYH69_05295, partial [Paraburkholderia sp. SARCC-3016]|uniref:hypothetical protein n=1 Tax=Paraburkholderia sp. SARCC-3016 TaxID=3058611 RepID=UPI00280A0280
MAALDAADAAGCAACGLNGAKAMMAPAIAAAMIGFWFMRSSVVDQQRLAQQFVFRDESCQRLESELTWEISNGRSQMQSSRHAGLDDECSRADASLNFSRAVNAATPPVRAGLMFSAEGEPDDYLLSHGQ